MLLARVETGDLEDEGAVVMVEVVDLVEEGVVPEQTNVLKPKSVSTSQRGGGKQTELTPAISSKTIFVNISGPP